MSLSFLVGEIKSPNKTKTHSVECVNLRYTLLIFRLTPQEVAPFSGE